ncbi:Rrf2 family transcriptional regulator [Winogradskya humida]|uniref:Rrf2 family transcriptional regulator n=1 Tax=Winogradskya humida TaxID=113566 RepID=A0ABQ3ZZA7_9ACTN|nr:Rrf2 family transcriptional regulator [Actinoplanes humidus]GIE23926.1 Rrf2 family transcriptional regulator [Actinoplanes humidus]
MSANSKLTVAVHALAWMGLHQSRGHEVSTSEQIAASVGTNAVVIRRLLGDLRRAGLTESRRGAGSGWVLGREPAAITVLDVYDALDDGPVFALHHSEPDPGCVVGGGIQPVLSGLYGRVDGALRAELARTTIADVLKGILTAH